MYSCWFFYLIAVGASPTVSVVQKKEEGGEWAQIFKSYFSKMVLAKEEALSELAHAKQVLTELKAEVDKMSLNDLD